MKNKFIKKSIIISSILSASIIATPLLLTSCSNVSKDGQGIETPIALNNITVIDFVNKLTTKKFVDDQGKEKDVFWLDAKDFHGFENTNAEVAKLHDEVIVNTHGFKNDLVEKKFTLVSEEFTEGVVGKKDSYFKTINDDATLEYLMKLINDIKFSNSTGENVDNSTEIDGNSLNLKTISSQVDISTRISFIDKVVDHNVSVKDSKQYSIELIFSPKKDYKWNIDDEKNNKAPLVITINDYVDKIMIVPNLFDGQLEKNSSNEVKVKSSSAFDSNLYGINLENFQSFRSSIYNKLGFEIKKNIESRNTIGWIPTLSSTENKEIQNNDSFGNFINDLQKPTKSDTLTWIDPNNQTTSFDFVVENLNDAIKYKRINASLVLLKLKMDAPQQRNFDFNMESKVYVGFDLLLNNKNKSDTNSFSWYSKQKEIVEASSNQNNTSKINILMKFN